MNRNVRLLLVAAFLSHVGDWLYRMALPLLVYHLTHSPLSVAVTYALEYIPYIIASPMSGVLADRRDRRQVLLTVDLCAAAVTLILAALLGFGIHPLWLIYGAAGLLSTAGALYHPSVQALLPSLVPMSDITKSTAVLRSIESITALLGPLVGGSVILVLGTTTAIVLDGVSFLVSAIAIAAIRNIRCSAALASSRSIWSDLREAAVYVRLDRVVLTASLLFSAVNFASALVQGNFVYYLADLHQLTPALIGIVIAAQGGGALIGSMLAPACRNRLDAGRLIVLSVGISGVATALLCFAASMVTIALSASAIGAGVAITAVTWFALRLERVPERLVGRVVALTRMLAFAAVPFGALAGGILLWLLGSFYPVIALSAGLQLALAGGGLLTPLVGRPASAWNLGGRPQAVLATEVEQS